jgi:hypothetical protein
MVQIIPALIPDSKSASAKTVPATGEMLEESKAWIPKRSAVAAEELEDRAEPATIRIALLMKRANVKREIESSAIEYLRLKFIAGREGWYADLVEVELGSWGVLRPAAMSYSRRRG